jgi:outer membrane protein OmpA-like peptidoglycan-associated protein
MRTKVIIGLAAAGLLATGCATKKYVGQEVSSVNKRVDDVQGQVEDAQTNIRRHDDTLQQHGSTLQRQGQEIQQTSKTAQDALDRALAAGKLAQGKFLYEVALTDDKVKFAFDKADLGEEGKAALSEFANQLKAENRGVYVEIQGHTDSVGSEEYNYKLGLERAEAVRRFLSIEGGIPLHRMEVISYGESAPAVESNGSSREARAQNRRVVLVVLQ